jgi:type I restriction enzyme M protein
VGIKDKEEAEDFDFEATLEEYNEELQGLNVEAKELEEQINLNVSKLLGVK